MDRYGEKVELNYNGKKKISTIPGLIYTVVSFILLMAYAYQKGLELIYRDQPNISETTINNYYTPQDKINLNSLNFKIAFGVADYFT